jgi:hypothetical protein
MGAAKPSLPARAVCHRLGRYGRGWLLPDGGVLTWAATKRDPAEHEHFAQIAGFTARQRERSLAFEIDRHGLLLARSGQAPLSDHQRTSVACAIVLAHAEKWYEQHRALSQGDVGLEPGRLRLAGLRHEDYRTALKALVGRGELRRRHCQSPSFALPALHRAALIEQRGLRSSWAKDTSWIVAPDDPTYGEITHALADATGERDERLWTQLSPYQAPNQPRPAREELVWLELAWQPADHERRRVRISWGPSSTLGRESVGEAALGMRTVLTQTPRDTPALILAAIGEEMQARVRERYANGEALETITRTLRGARPSWITQPVAWITD